VREDRVEEILCRQGYDGLILERVARRRRDKFILLSQLSRRVTRFIVWGKVRRRVTVVMMMMLTRGRSMMKLWNSSCANLATAPTMLK
jgi:hypothetical protein